MCLKCNQSAPEPITCLDCAEQAVLYTNQTSSREYCYIYVGGLLSITVWFKLDDTT